jgi:hypothetical protein|tara:strand:+ start:104 stop:592 length:489 start_codon:yes stop_codon:yes gene_type:complete
MIKRNRKGRADFNENGKSYCGPLTLTVITGRRYDIVEKHILKMRELNTRGFIEPWGNRVVRMKDSELRSMFRYYGYKMVAFVDEDGTTMDNEFWSNSTVRNWTKKTYGVRYKKWFVISTRNHYLVVSGNKVWDTYSPSEGISVVHMPHKKAKIRAVWEVTNG